MAVRLHDRQHRAGADRQRPQRARRRSASRWRTTNGYTPEQASDLYIADGTINDWLWGQHKIFSYTFEMFPTDSNPGFYPPDEVIGRETTRNREAVLMLEEAADCVYKVINLTCGGPAPTTVYFDNFETAGTWTPNAQGTDTATTGRFEQGDPASHHQQRDEAAGDDGQRRQRPRDRPAGGRRRPGDHDVDGGTTSISSPSDRAAGDRHAVADLQLLPRARHELEQRRLPARARDRQPDVGDGLHAQRRGDERQRRVGGNTVSLKPSRARRVRIVVEAADASTASLVEAGVDDVQDHEERLTTIAAIACMPRRFGCSGAAALAGHVGLDPARAGRRCTRRGRALAA